MSDSEQILLHTGLPPAETARRLGDRLHAQVLEQGGGRVAVRRPMASDPQRTIGGDVSSNDYGEDDPEPGDETIYDGYDTVFELWISGPSDEELLHTESRQLYDEILATLAWPAAHLNVNGLLYSASDPARGRTDFPGGTTYDRLGRALWEPYARPRLDSAP